MAFTVELLEPESPDLLSWVFKKFPRNAGLICTLYLFPVAAVTNCHRLGGLKQQKFIVFLLWRPENRPGGRQTGRSHPRSERKKQQGQCPAVCPAKPAPGGRRCSTGTEVASPVSPTTGLAPWPFPRLLQKDTQLLCLN